jgi:hypothetical protein
VSNEVLFRLKGAPVYRGSLVVYQPDPDLPQPVEGRPCIVLDFVWEDDSRMHVVEVLMDGEVWHCMRTDLTLV